MLDRNDKEPRCRNVIGIAFFVTASLLSFYYLVLDDRRLNLYLEDEDIRRRRTFLEESFTNNTTRYLVYSKNCHIQDINPYDKEILPYLKTINYMSCTKNPLLTYVVKHNQTHSRILINPKAVHSYSVNGVTCCYSTVTRTKDAKKPDDAIVISKCVPFKNNSVISDEFMIVKCATKNRHKEVYKNAHAAVHVRKSVRKRLDAAAEEREKIYPGKSRPLSVLLVGIDSISRLNSMRTMPKTISYLRSLGWTELRGYNKIGDNTFPNLMAVLTGLEGDGAYNICLPTVPGRLDNCTFIWQKYHDNGYVTGYAEDEATISTFNFNKVGFLKPPTDYYLRPLVIAAQNSLKNVVAHSLLYCVGPESAGERIFNYAQDFTKKFINDTSFGLFWTNSFSHNDLNFPSSMDNTLLKFFQDLQTSNVPNSSFIIFFSDHGMRFGDVRQTKLGWFEERLPYIWLSLPEWWMKEHPEETAALKLNMNRLTTPYDLHMTLQHFIELETGEEQTESQGCPSCHSLFIPVNPDRSCEDAKISPHWCTCTEFNPTDIKSDVVKSAALQLVTTIKGYIKEHKAEKKCARLSLNRIMLAQKGYSTDQNTTYYLLLIETLPGRGKFEGTVSHVKNELGDKFELHSSISRLDTYGGQSNCINDSFLKKYCYCR